jgi:hypothetical protein
VASGWPFNTLTHSLYYDGYNQKRTTLAGWQPTYVTTNVSANYYSTTFGLAPINYFQGSIGSAYTPFTYSKSITGVYYYAETFAVKSVSGGTAGTSVNYNFTVNMNLVSYHNNSTTVSLSL